MARFALCGFVLALAGCASPQRLSASIYEHEQLASRFEANGAPAAAAAQRRDAERERERLGAITPIGVSRDNW